MDKKYQCFFCKDYVSREYINRLSLICSRCYRKFEKGEPIMKNKEFKSGRKGTR